LTYAKITIENMPHVTVEVRLYQTITIVAFKSIYNMKRLLNYQLS